MLLTLMLACLMIFSGCSNKPPEVIYEVRYEKQYIPLDLLIIDCSVASPGVTARELAMSWVNNTGCLRAHKKLIEGLIKNYTEEGVLTNEHSK